LRHANWWEGVVDSDHEFPTGEASPAVASVVDFDVFVVALPEIGLYMISLITTG
jgi:hypothetical protein